MGVISGYNFADMEAMKYYAPPASWSKEKKKKNAIERIYSGLWIGAEKKDGYFCRIVKDSEGQIALYTRSRNVQGVFPEKHEWVPHLNSFFSKLPNGTCVLGELYLPSKPGSSNITTLLGCLKEKCIARQESGEKLHLYIFDVLAYKDELLLNEPAKNRITYLPLIDTDEFTSVAVYHIGETLWNNVTDILAKGGEGVVILNGSGVYEPGKRSSKTSLKIKKELEETIDCFFTGVAMPPTRTYNGKEVETWKYWVNSATGERIEGELYKEYEKGATIEPVSRQYFYRMAASLEVGVLKDGKVVPIGYISGINDEIRLNFKNYKHRVVEITAMEVFETGGLRHPKIVQFRDDLTIKDCTWEKCFGNKQL